VPDRGSAPEWTKVLHLISETKRACQARSASRRAGLLRLSSSLVWTKSLDRKLLSYIEAGTWASSRNVEVVVPELAIPPHLYPLDEMTTMLCTVRIFAKARLIFP
jgi:hypothetical protein